jgi:hypothetical protein
MSANEPDDNESPVQSMKLRQKNDPNAARMQLVPIRISASRKNIDVQRVILEFKERVEKLNEKFVVSDLVSDMFRDGCRRIVEQHPELATPEMFKIAGKSEEIAKMPRVQPTGIIPLLTEYHRKKLDGMTILKAYQSKRISKQDVVDIFYSSINARIEIMGEKELDDIIWEALRQTPGMEKLLKDEVEVWHRQGKR